MVLDLSEVAGSAICKRELGAIGMAISDNEKHKDGIVPIPDLPDEIKNAVDQGKLAVFIGAGASRLVGCKGWSELAYRLVDAAYDDDLINYKEKTTLKNDKNPKKIISICKHIFDKTGKNDVFYDTIENSLRPNPKKGEQKSIYKTLYKLRAVYVTTNVDKSFDELYFKDRIVYKSRDLQADKIDRTRLYHLHGTINDHTSMVFTTREYLEHYNNEDVNTFLKKIFSEYIVLFVGYGMEELEVLDFLITKENNPPIELKHFILLPMYLGEENILKFEKAYYSDLGISVVPYALDLKGFEQLYDVIEKWQEDINLISTFTHERFEEIDANADHYENEAAGKIFQWIKNDTHLENYFFKKITTADWLTPLKERGYFDPSKNQPPILIGQEGHYKVPHWNVLDYLEKASEQIAVSSPNGDDKHVEELMDIIRSVSKTGVDNYYTNFMFVKIMGNLPTSFIEIEDLELVRQYLNTKFNNHLISFEIYEKFFSRFVEAGTKEKVLKLLEIVTSVKWVIVLGKEHLEPLIGEYELNELFKKIKDRVSELFPLEAARIIIRKIAEIVLKKQDEFNIALIPAIEDHPQNSFPDQYQNILVRMARGLLNIAVNNDEENTKETLRKLLQENHSIFKRLSISVINTNWSNCSDLFWDNACRDIIHDFNLHHEVYTVFKNHYKTFSHKQKNIIIDWIEAGPDRIDDVDETQDAFWKQSWLSSLLTSDYKPAIRLYRKYEAITGIEPEHPDFVFWSEGGGFVTHISPLEVPEIIQKDNEHMAEYLIDYEEDQKGWDTPSKEGLEQALYFAVKSKPNKFDNNLEPFLKVPLNYVSRIIWGFCDAWEDKKEINWSNILDYCKQIISSKKFTESNYKEDVYGYNDRIVSQIADLLIEGTKDDSHAIDIVHLPKAKETILIMLKLTGTHIQNPDDLLFSTLNSERGRIFSALVEYVLHVARLDENKDIPSKWNENIKDEFTRRLDRNIEPSLEWSVSLGKYLPNLYYVDKSWVEENINYIFPKSDDGHWQATMEGYLFISHQVYNALYELLKINGHYLKAIDTKFKNEGIRKRLVDHLCVGYLRGKDNLTDEKSLFLRCLNCWNTEDILEIISFFWMQRKYLVDNSSTENKPEKVEIVQKIIEFWRYVFEKLIKKIDTLSEDENEILSAISKLSCYIKNINEEKLSWIKLSAKFIEQSPNIPYLLENLDRLSDTSPDKVGAIYLTILAHYTPSDYKNHIRSIVEKLYKSGNTENANRICNMYFRSGFEFLRDIYENHKQELKNRRSALLKWNL